MSKTLRKQQERLMYRRAQFDKIKEKDGRKRPGSMNAHKGSDGTTSKR